LAFPSILVDRNTAVNTWEGVKIGSIYALSGSPLGFAAGG
jgi:hypothetical protein